MQFAIGLVTGLVLGAIALALIRRPDDAAWVSFSSGLLGALALGLAMSPLRNGAPGIMVISIGLPFAALVFGIGTIIRGGRRWMNWTGLVLAAVPTLFWAIFLGAELIFPH